jgi:hypothetical protein
MLSFLARLSLTASALAPVCLTLAWVAWYQAENVVALVALCVAGLLTCGCILLLRYARRSIEIIPFNAQGLEPADAESLAFMLIYLLPLFTDKVATLNWELWVPVIIVFSVIVGTGYAYHFNPLLSLLRWHFYKVTAQDGVVYILITKKHLRTAASIHRVGQLTEYILIDLDGS